MTTSTAVVARLVIAGADRAVDFYQRALEDGMDRSATTLGGSPVIFMLVVDDADAVAASLQQAGATVVIPVSDSSYGYRQGRLADPFGFQWMISQDIEELTDAQTQERLDADAR